MVVRIDQWEAMQKYNISKNTNFGRDFILYETDKGILIY